MESKSKNNTIEKTLLDLFIRGFKDEKNGTSTNISNNNIYELKLRAYKLGANHFKLFGTNDIWKLSDEVILNTIKNPKGENEITNNTIKDKYSTINKH